MTIKEIYAIVKELEDHIEETCCAITLDPLDVKDLITKLRIAINEYDKQNKKKSYENETNGRPNTSKETEESGKN